MNISLFLCPTFHALRISLQGCIDRKRRGKWLKKNVKRRQANPEAQGLMVCGECKHIKDPDDISEPIPAKLLKRYVYSWTDYKEETIWEKGEKNEN